jgi:cellulose biosynthesis protein BcsQ
LLSHSSLSSFHFLSSPFTEGYDGRFNVFHALAPQLLLGVNEAILPAQLTQVVDNGRENGIGDRLFLLPGHQQLATIDSFLARALSGSDFGSVGKLGVLFCMLQMTAKFYNIDVILLDLPPSLSPMTRVAIMSSHYFMIPFTSDFFSYEAIRSLQQMILTSHAAAAPPSDREDRESMLRSKIRESIRQDQNWFDWFKARVTYDNFEYPASVT